MVHNEQKRENKNHRREQEQKAAEGLHERFKEVITMMTESYLQKMTKKNSFIFAVSDGDIMCGSL